MYELIKFIIILYRREVLKVLDLQRQALDGSLDAQMQCYGFGKSIKLFKESLLLLC